MKAATASLAQAALYLRILRKHVDKQFDDEPDAAAAAAKLMKLIPELEAFTSGIDRLVPDMHESIEQIKNRLRSQD